MTLQEQLNNSQEKGIEQEKQKQANSAFASQMQSTFSSFTLQDIQKEISSVDSNIWTNVKK